MNYLVYPLSTMRITQSYNGTFSHEKYFKGKPQSFPWDEGGKDGGRDWLYCPCDEMEIKRIYGLGNPKAGNTIWLQSTSKVKTPTFEDFVTLLVIHPNDDDVAKLKVGQKFKRGQAIVREGTDGNATGNHFHFEIGKGKFVPNGWKKNNLGAWALTTSPKKPEECFYIDKTTVIDSKGLDFVKIPNNELEKIKNQNELLKLEIITLENKIQELLVDNDKLNLKIKQLENYSFEFLAKNTGYFKIKLYSGEKLIIK